MSSCPGCGLALPPGDAVYDGYFDASPECWAVYTEVLGHEYGDAVLFGQVHQLTVDAYAVQHAGGPQPDKSVAIHLAGLHFVLVRGHAPTTVPKLLQRIAANVAEWPHFPPPDERSALTVQDVLQAEDHAATVREWARQVWDAWSAHHDAVAAFVASAFPR